MNALGLALVWCAVQVTLVATAALLLDLVVRRLGRTATGPLLFGSLTVILALSALALSPWPRWAWPIPTHAAATQERTVPAVATLESVPDTDPGSPAERDTVSAEPSSPDGGTSIAALLQALNEPRTAEPSAPSSGGWRWPGVVAAVFLAGAALSFVWLLAGVGSSRRYRRGSRPVEEPRVLELLDVLRAELSCRVPIALRQCDRLPTAATLGLTHPLILLPAGWRRWSDDQLRAVLAHELAHVRGRDFLGVVCGRLGQVLHFYHPLVHALVARLRLEQELAADAAAASVSGGQRAYLRAIAELALEQSARPVPWPARAFLPTKTTFLRRITMLRDTDLSLRRRAPLTRAAALVAVLICGLGAVGLRGPGSSPLAAAQEAGAPSASLPAAEPGGGFDFQYVPESAVAIWGIRPAALLADPRLAEARKALRDVSLPGFQFTVPIPEVEQALYLHIRVPDRERPFRFIGILRATQPQRFEEFIRRTHPETHVEVIDGQTYYIPGNFSRRGAVCIRPDEYTLIHGEGYNDWDEAYSSAKKGMPGFLPQEVWNEFRDAYAVGAVRAPEFLPLTERARNHRRMRAFPEFAPFWEDSQWGIVGLRWNEEGFRLDGMIQGNDAPSAQRVDETWVAAKTLLANFIRQNEPLSGFPFTATAAIRETMGSSRGVIEQTIRQTRTQQDGSVVRATCALKAGDDVLASTFVIACRLREALLRAESANNLAHINLAMHNYHDLHKHFPPPILYSETGVPYSWRVALLPVMGHEAIYEKYRFDEPWNSPSNLQLAATMVPEYVSPTEPHSTHTAYLALTGPATAFEPGPGTAFRDIADGASNTIVLVEADRAIPWTKPEDIPYDAAQPMPELGGFFQGGFHAAMGDGSVRFFSDRIAPDLLRALITKSGGETVDRDRVLQASGGAP